MEKKIYFAPMEGITGYIYRRAHARFFPGIDKYFTPFLSPGQKKVMTPREKRDILPEHNEGIPVVPQILANQPDVFVKCAKELQAYGYEEINLNLGCPSGTVTAKKKGAGFLAFPVELDRFLEEIFTALDMKISIKTRLGKEDAEEFEALLKIYNQYPLEELIIHPRVQADYYKNTPNYPCFSYALKESRSQVCYNGDLFTKGLWEKFSAEYPGADTVMLGRGLIRNPALALQIKNGETLEKERLKAFHDTLCADYTEQMSGDRNVLFKLKELWHYMITLFPDSQKEYKRIKKSQKLGDYQAAVESLFREREIKTEQEVSF